MKIFFEATGEDADALLAAAEARAAKFAGERRWVIKSIRVTVRDDDKTGGFGGTGWVKAWVEA